LLPNEAEVMRRVAGFRPPLMRLEKTIFWGCGERSGMFPLLYKERLVVSTQRYPSLSCSRLPAQRVDGSLLPAPKSIGGQAVRVRRSIHALCDGVG
jgi:hypothetical protein